MNRKRLHTSRVLGLLVGLCLCCVAQAQEFKVKSFRPLPNDITAYITPVRDLNEEACALIKVVAPEEFAFSTPLGVVSRRTEVGEIWLYVPKGTRQITVKHPSWGVLRDYRFPQVLESRMTYELVIDPPPSVRTEQWLKVRKHPSRVFRPESMRPMHPDRLSFGKKRRTPLPWECAVTLSAAAGKDVLLPGLRVALMKRHGFYVFGQTSFRKAPATVADCDGNGYIAAEGYTPYYADANRASAFLCTAGLVHRLSTRFYCYEGGGYGSYALAWQTAEGAWVRNADAEKKGWAAEAGLMVRMKSFHVTAGAQTIAGGKWTGVAGIGVFF